MTVSRIVSLINGRRLSWVVGAISLALALLASLLSAAQVAKSSEKELDRRAETARELIERRIETYTEVLHSVSGLRSSSQTLTRREFHNYIRALDVLKRYPGVQVIGFGELVRGDRTVFERETNAKIAASGLPYGPFAINPTGVRDAYAPISYIEPQQGNKPALGYDFLNEPHRRAALERSRDTGTPAATAPVKLQQETGSQSGFLIMRATYRPGTHPETVHERRESFVGVEYAAFRMGDLLAGVLVQEGPGYALEVYDRGLINATRPVRLSLAARTYDTDGRADALVPGGEAKSRLLPINVGGRRWDIHYRATDPLVSPQERAAPWMIGALGLVLSVLATWLFWMMSTARERALRLAVEMTAQLRESERQLARSNRELERFAYVASHDLQEPLRTVSSFVGLLDRRYSDKLDERAKRYIAFAVDATGRMSRMISELLTYSRVGRADSEPVPTDLGAAWDEAVANLGGSIEQEGARVTRTDLPTIMATELHAVQLFQNLISNALKYRSPEPPTIEAVAGPAGDGRHWRITVRDNGIGIDARHHERVFVIFQRLHTAEEYPGTGMGLAICKKIVESYGGRIWVESQPGEGSTFHITLPMISEPVAELEFGPELVGTAKGSPGR